jgi:hypothetical protein
LPRNLYFEVPSQQQNTKRTEAIPTTESTALSHINHPPSEQSNKGTEESWAMDTAESGKYTPDERDRDRDIIAHLEESLISEH